MCVENKSNTFSIEAEQPQHYRVRARIWFDLGTRSFPDNVVDYRLRWFHGGGNLDRAPLPWIHDQPSGQSDWPSPGIRRWPLSGAIFSLLYNLIASRILPQGAEQEAPQDER